MKYAIALGSMSAAFAAGAFVYPRLGILLVWVAASFGWVALGYAGIGASVFGKRKCGRIPLGIKTLILPYLLYTLLIWHLYRIVSRESAYNQVDDNLVLGRRLLKSEIPDGFDHYVDLTAEFEDPVSIRSKPSYFSFPILDASVPSIEDLANAVEAVEYGRTYVHCAQGHGRTGLFALALLIRRDQISSVSAGIDLLKKARPGINLNREQARLAEIYLTQARNK